METEDTITPDGADGSPPEPTGTQEVEPPDLAPETPPVTINLPVPDASEALTGQLAHRITFLEAAVHRLTAELANRGFLPPDFAEELIAAADAAVAANQARATTPGRSGLAGLSLAERS